MDLVACLRRIPAISAEIRVLLDHVASERKVDCAAFAVRNDATLTNTFWSDTRSALSVTGETIPIPEEVDASGLMRKTGKPIQWDDVEGSGIFCPFMSAEAFRSLLMVPVRFESELHYTQLAMLSRPPRRWNADDIDALTETAARVRAVLETIEFRATARIH